MTSINKLHSIDHVCDYIPIVGTLTNAGILLLKLAMKVNLVANPNGPGLWGDLKIHAVEKSVLDAFMAMIPIVNFYYKFAQNFTLANQLSFIKYSYDYLETVIIRSEIDKIKCHLQRYPMKANDLQPYLRRAVCSAKPEVMNYLFNYTKWTQEQIVDSLTTWVKEESILNTTFLMNQWDQLIPSQLSNRKIEIMQTVMLAFVNEKEISLGKQMLIRMPSVMMNYHLQLFMQGREDEISQLLKKKNQI